jgi:hypothetical protein
MQGERVGPVVGGRIVQLGGFSALRAAEWFGVKGCNRSPHPYRFGL